MSILNGQTLLAGAMSGLANTYSTLMSESSSGSGISMDDLSNLSSKQMLNLGGNYSFVQYLTSNFSNIDQDGDGKITGNDLQNLMNTMQSKGLTYNEIQSLCATGNVNSSLLSTVLTYFNKIDKNGDGRVTSEEITKFSLDCQQYEVEAKYKSYKASETSLYISSVIPFCCGRRFPEITNSAIFQGNLKWSFGYADPQMIVSYIVIAKAKTSAGVL